MRSSYRHSREGVLAVALFSMAVTGCKKEHATSGLGRHDGASSSSAVVISTPAPDVDKERIAVRWSSALRLQSLSQVAAALDHVDEQGFGTLTLGDREVTPKTCQEWIALHGQGFEPKNQLEAQADSGAKVRCGTLAWLGAAKPASVSALSNLEWNATLPARLPAALATAVSRDERARLEAATTQGQSLQQFERNLRVQTSDAGSAIQIAEDANRVILIDEQARGDFDGDGREDLVVSVTNAVTAGSYFATRLLLLSLREGSEVFAIARSM